MASYNKFHSFVEALAEKQHNLGSDQLALALTNTAPLNSHAQLSQITQISYTNLSSRNLTLISSVQTSGVYRLILNDLTLTATGGNVGPFRYIVVYNDTSLNDNLIGWYDIGTSITLLDGGDPLPIDFDQTNGLIQLS